MTDDERPDDPRGQDDLGDLAHLADLPARAAKVRMLLVDVDGTMTDGGLYYLSNGELALRFHVRDGLGLWLARQAGLVVGLVSGRDVPQVRARAAELQLEEVHLGVRDKKSVLLEISARRNIPLEAISFIGDDLVDVPPMELCGLPCAVADAVPAARAAAAFVTEARGGYGAVREVVDLILASR